MYSSKNLFTAFLHTHHFPGWGGRRKTIKPQISSCLVLAAAIAMGLSSFLLILSVVVVFIFLFPSEYNWILEHIHVVMEVVLVT